MSKSNITFSILYGLLVTSYISFIITFINIGFLHHFIITWIRNWVNCISFSGSIFTILIAISKEKIKCKLIFSDIVKSVIKHAVKHAVIQNWGLSD